MHSITISGYLGKDPEMRYTQEGKPVTNFSVGSKDWDSTTWFRIACFGSLAEATNEHLAKGRYVVVRGRLRADNNGHPRIWRGNDGTARANFEVVAGEVEFGPNPNKKQAQDSYDDNGHDYDEDSLPF